MTTKDQIEAAANVFLNKVDVLLVSRESPCSLIREVFNAGALWMQALMEKLIEQRERAAWDAARELCRFPDHGADWKDETFEDWKKKHAN